MMADRVAVTDDPRATAGVLTHEDVLLDPVAYRHAALRQAYRSLTIGPVTFHGIAACGDPAVATWIARHYPAARPTLSFFRRSPVGQVEPNFIHTDRDMGDWTGILYLTPDPPLADGTTFWRHRQTGATASQATTPAAIAAEQTQWRQRSQWEPWATVSARFGRLLLFPAALFHSRAIPENYGTDDDHVRLIQVIFGTGTLHLKGAPPSWP